MKKTVVLILLISLLFCGCSRVSLGNAAELFACDWRASTGGGGEISLSFCEDYASLVMRNAGEERKIEGRVVAGDKDFVIFDSVLQQNYAFGYVPGGDFLELSYGGKSVTLKRQPRI